MKLAIIGYSNKREREGARERGVGVRVRENEKRKETNYRRFQCQRLVFLEVGFRKVNESRVDLSNSFPLPLDRVQQPLHLRLAIEFFPRHKHLSVCTLFILKIKTKSYLFKNIGSDWNRSIDRMID
jgi:hypothetical protein